MKHYFVNSHSIKENLSAAGFETYALRAADMIFKKNDIAVMVGGTGLYIKAFCEGMDPIPAIDEGVRKTIMQQYEEKGMEWLQEQIKDHDPEFYSNGEIQNPQRMMRALEIKLTTGYSIVSYQSKQKKIRDFNIIKIGLELPREKLYHRINVRVDIMITEGLVDEAKALLPYKDLNALQTVGYRELFSYFNHEISFVKAIDLVKQNTRHYAKRQLTWFKKDEAIHWCNPNATDVIDKVNGLLI